MSQFHPLVNVIMTCGQRLLVDPSSQGKLTHFGYFQGRNVPNFSSWCSITSGAKKGPYPNGLSTFELEKIQRKFCNLHNPQCIIKTLSSSFRKKIMNWLLNRNTLFLKFQWILSKDWTILSFIKKGRWVLCKGPKPKRAGINN